MFAQLTAWHFRAMDDSIVAQDEKLAVSRWRVRGHFYIPDLALIQIR